MIPFYTFYSMFGFQRTGDQIWQFGDMRGKGFLIGATAGRTTLNGEGLQHQDGHSQLLASPVPNGRAYDPAFAYELGVIIHDGITPHVHLHRDGSRPSDATGCIRRRRRSRRTSRAASATISTWWSPRATT
jgi:pyruvate dehydrogenase complex dehydrogenase (E1) component